MCLILQWDHVREIYAADVGSTAEAEVLQTLTKLRKSLGHPTNADLARLLTHGHASDLAIKLARDFWCSFGQRRIKPGSWSERCAQHQFVGILKAF